MQSSFFSLGFASLSLVSCSLIFSLSPSYLFSLFSVSFLPFRLSSFFLFFFFFCYGRKVWNVGFWVWKNVGFWILSLGLKGSILWWLLVWFWLVGCSGLVSMGLACGSDVHWCLVSMSMQCPSFETRFSQNRVKPYSDVFKRAYSNVLRTYSGIF